MLTWTVICRNINGDWFRHIVTNNIESYVNKCGWNVVSYHLGEFIGYDTLGNLIKHEQS